VLAWYILFLLQVVDNDFRFIHAAGNLDSVASLSFVIIGDGANKKGVANPPPELQQEFSEALASNHLKTAVLKIGIMPDRDAATDATIRAVANDSKVRELWQIFSRWRMVQKGCPNASTEANAAIELFLHKAGRVGCTYFAKVVEAMKRYLRSRGYDSFKFRYHINWKGLFKTFCLEHGFHWDSINTALEADEEKMMRVIGVVDIPFTELEWVALTKEVVDLKFNVPEKEDCEGYKFVVVVGKPLYPPALYISVAPQNALTRKVRTKYVQLLKADGFLHQEHLDSDDDDDAAASEDEEAGAGGTSSG
jgi:hypothetical protein